MTSKSYTEDNTPSAEDIGEYTDDTMDDIQK